MKTNLLRGWRWLFSVSIAVALLGCLDEPAESNAQSAPALPGITNIEPQAVAEEVPPLKAVIPPANLSAGLPEIVELAQSAVGDEVLLAYIGKSGRSFNPTVDEIVYLKDLGLSEAVIAALVRSKDALNVPAIATNPSSSDATAHVTPEPALQENRPSLVEAPAPSYTVTADPAYTEVAAAPAQQVNITYFETALAPYGSWVEVADYGRCWQPTVVVINRGWRPYGDRGRWLYTSAGWYWQSDYSWGWAPFHYGRWHCDDRVGWVWVPGSTWGPAWVSWRYTDSYCGWAPLPPAAHYDGFGFRYHNSRVGISFDFGLRDDRYTFIPTSRFCDRTPYRFYASQSHSKTIYRNSIVINNYVRGNNSTVINEGIGRDRINRATPTPVRTVVLRDLPTTASPAGRAERLEGNSISVYRPNVSTRTATAHARSTPARETTATPTPNRQPHRAVTPVPARSTASLQQTENGRTSSRTTSTPIANVAEPNSNPTFSRTWTRPSPIVRPTPVESRSTAPTVATPAEIPNHANEVPTAPSATPVRQLPSYSNRSYRQQAPSSINQTAVARDAGSTRQETTRIQPYTAPQPAAQPAVRNYAPRTIQRESTIPSVTRSLPSQPSPSVPNYGNQNTRVERSAPQSIQSFQRSQAPAVSVQREQPQQRVQSQPQRSETPSRQQVDRSDRGSRDRKN